MPAMPAVNDASTKRDRADAGQVDAGPARGLGVPADRVQVAAERRAAEQDRPHARTPSTMSTTHGTPRIGDEDAAVGVADQDERDARGGDAGDLERW